MNKSSMCVGGFSKFFYFFNFLITEASKQPEYKVIQGLVAEQPSLETQNSLLWWLMDWNQIISFRLETEFQERLVVFGEG